MTNLKFLYLDKDNEEKAKQIVEAVYNATNGTFKGEYCTTTLLGMAKTFDLKGRDVTIDCNTCTSSINIENETYGLVVKGYKAVIVKPKYRDVVRQMFAPEECLIARISFMPEFVKEYWEKVEDTTGEKIFF